MVTSRQQRERGAKQPLEEWTLREKLCLASLAIKHGNAWNSVARNMVTFVDKDRPEGWLNQKNCAAQFEKIMNELGVDKRPKRNEPSGGNSSSVIYKKMTEKRIKELEEKVTELRKNWLNVKQSLRALDGEVMMEVTVKNEQVAAKPPKSATKPLEGRAITRRESTRKNLVKTLATLCKEAAELKNIDSFGKPSQKEELELYDKLILRHVDFETIKRKLEGEVDDPYEVLTDLLLMFQNAIMYYPQHHSTHKAAIELRAKMIPKWEKALFSSMQPKAVIK